MKTVGIVGGLGPETTAKFYMEIILGCSKENPTQRPPILIWNVPLPLNIEEDLILRSIGEKRYLPFLIEAARKLEKAGADFLVLPCNSLHVFISEIKKSVKIPVLSIVEETTRVLVSKKSNKVGLIATSTTIKHRLYKDDLKKIGIKEIVPNGKDQKEIDKIIDRLVLSQHQHVDRQKLLIIINKFKKKGVHIILLACTDLQLIVPNLPGVQIFDTMKILADATILKIVR